jgi:hypothetical protein
MVKRGASDGSAAEALDDCAHQARHHFMRACPSLSFVAQTYFPH